MPEGPAAIGRSGYNGAAQLRGRFQMLTYPIGETLECETARAITPGVLWIRFSVTFAPGHINVWALEDGDGWTIVDTGMRLPAAAEVWESLWTGALGGRPVRRVICTHQHRDHAGMAGWLTARFGCRLWMTRLEYLHGRLQEKMATGELSEATVRFVQGAGWEADAIEHYRERLSRFNEGCYPLPPSYRRIVDGEAIAIGRHVWKVIVGRGHSPDHACLHCPELRVLISGDQVLPGISSNVSVDGMEPDADPLSDWIASLKLLESRVGDETLVLPSHNAPFLGLHERLRELDAGHEDALRRALEFIAVPRRAIDLFELLFHRKVGLALQGLATGESVAHLNCLIHRGLVEVEEDRVGIRWYRALPGPGTDTVDRQTLRGYAHGTERCSDPGGLQGEAGRVAGAAPPARNVRSSTSSRRA